MTSPDLLDIVPEHVVEPVRRASRPARLLTACGDGLLSLVGNAVVVAWLAGIGWPQPPAEAPQAISVDLVDHMPGKAAKNGAGPSSTSGGSGKTDSKQAKTDVDTPAQVDHAAAPQPPTPAETKQARADAPPSQPAETVPPVQPDQPPAGKVAAPAPSAQAVPPPPEHPDNNPQPRLVEVPAPPRPADTQTETRAKPVVAPPESPAAVPTAGPPPAQPKVLSAESAADVVPTVTPPPPKPPGLTAEQKREADNTATLAAVLPYGASIAADPFRAQVSAQGQAMNEAYRGAVYDNFNTKAADVQDEARARHLKGTVVVAFSVDDQGRLASSNVALSSGQPELDQLAMEMIRRAAPFPAPPPGARRAFSTALTFGGND